MNTNREPTCFSVEDLFFDTHLRKVEKEGANIGLTPREYQVLLYLASRFRAQDTSPVVSRKEFLHELYFGERRSPDNIDVSIGKIRKKIEAAKSKVVILTVREAGYELKPSTQAVTIGAAAE